MKTLQFTICRNPENTTVSDIEYWVYEDVMGATQRGNYIVVNMPNRSAFIPGWWIKEVKELDGEPR